MAQGLHVQFPVLFQAGQQTVLTVELLVAIVGFRNAVGVEVEGVPRIQLHLVAAVGDSLHTGQHKVGLDAQIFKLPVPPAQQGRIVARIRVGQTACG